MPSLSLPHVCPYIRVWTWNGRYFFLHFAITLLLKSTLKRDILSSVDIMLTSDFKLVAYADDI
jgi:hypothetical protein